MNTKLSLLAVVAALALPFPALAASAEASAAPKLDKRLVQRGQYLAKTAGCNDCHTPGYAMSGGKVPESQWLVGDSLGWRGPWGTTYPINLRLYMRDMTEAKWVKTAKTAKSRPPMPWFALHDMTETDLRSIYHFVRSLGPAGEPAPIYLAPGVEPKGPYIQFPAPPK